MANSMTMALVDTGEASADPSFGVGDVVRVKPGIPDPDFPDVALDGCTGEVVEVDGMSPLRHYLVQWDEQTTRRLWSLCRERCESADVVFDCMWLFAEDFETPRRF